MNTETALNFLRQHQPLPSTRSASNALLKEFDDVRRLFTCDLDPRSVPLLIGALGEGDGHGIYQMVETTLQAYPDDVVVAALKVCLISPHRSVRYWSSQFAANYPCDELLDELVNVCRAGGIDERLAAVTAIEVIGTARAKEHLRHLLALNVEPAVKEMIKAALGEQWLKTQSENAVDRIDRRPQLRTSMSCMACPLQSPALTEVFCKQALGLAKGEAGRFAELASRAEKADKLTPHHMPQAAAGFTNRADGGALRAIAYSP